MNKVQRQEQPKLEKRRRKGEQSKKEERDTETLTQEERNLRRLKLGAVKDLYAPQRLLSSDNRSMRCLFLQDCVLWRKAKQENPRFVGVEKTEGRVGLWGKEDETRKSWVLAVNSKQLNQYPTYVRSK